MWISLEYFEPTRPATSEDSIYCPVPSYVDQNSAMTDDNSVDDRSREMYNYFIIMIVVFFFVYG